MRPRITRKAWALGGCLLLVGLTWLFFHQEINRFVNIALLLRSPSPREEVFEQVTTELPDPTPFLERCWATGKVPHRQLVASFLRNQSTGKPAWFLQVQRLLREAATDPDMTVREFALAALQASADPRLFEAACAQLSDSDPLVRQLGLDYLRRLDAHQAVPMVMKLLEDPDLRVVASAEVALMRWTGHDFGVRTHLAIPSGENGHQLDPAHVEKIRQGVEQRKVWWQAHAGEFAPLATAVSKAEPNQPTGPSVEDFTLSGLDGKPVRLADFRDKPILLNFWATWCTACLAEIPDLIALHKRLGDRVAIIGVALDGVPDEHGHQTGEEDDKHNGKEAPSGKTVATKVSRVVKARGINYPVLLDPNAVVGRRFNGGELPTTVILDSRGHLRRRFIGERNLQVFEAMLADIGK